MLTFNALKFEINFNCRRCYWSSSNGFNRLNTNCCFCCNYDQTILINNFDVLQILRCVNERKKTQIFWFRRPVHSTHIYPWSQSHIKNFRLELQEWFVDDERLILFTNSSLDEDCNWDLSYFLPAWVLFEHPLIFDIKNFRFHCRSNPWWLQWTCHLFC